MAEHTIEPRLRHLEGEAVEQSTLTPCGHDRSENWAGDASWLQERS